jgi:pre-mRNA-splicing factor SPF27
VDAPPDERSLAAAKALIANDIKTAGIDTAHLHPALIPAATYTPKYSDAVEEEHARLAAKPASKLSAIDPNRYEIPDAPSNTDATEWSVALKMAYTSSEYVNARLIELGLLEKFGKNSWLVGNAQLEDILKSIEAELADVRRQQDEVDDTRRSQQESVHGEIQTLEETWKRGVGRVLETEVAAEGLKQQILERRRAGAV